MRKAFVLAAVMAAAFAAPVAPVQAQSDAPTAAYCLLLPWTKACREMAVEVVEEATPAVRMNTAAEVTVDAVTWPWGWSCERAEPGSGHLYDCEK